MLVVEVSYKFFLLPTIPKHISLLPSLPIAHTYKYSLTKENYVWLLYLNSWALCQILAPKMSPKPPVIAQAEFVLTKVRENIGLI